MTYSKKGIFLKGYIGIEIEGFYLERFLNICTKEKINLWKINKKSDVSIEANIPAQEFKKVKTIAKKTKTRVIVKTRNGIPFLVQKYKKRKVFMALFGILIATIMTLSRFVWNIELYGNNKIPTEELLNELYNNGLKIRKMEIKDRY